MVITQLAVAEVQLPDTHPRSGRCPVYAYLVELNDTIILVDTGVARGNSFVDENYRPAVEDFQQLLGEREIEAEQVSMIVNTHLHFDHIGHNRRFPGIPLVAQKTELELARSGRYTVDDWLDFEGARWLPVDGPSEIGEGLSLIPTPGHTPGHQSLLVTSGSERALFVGQVAYDPDEFDDGKSTEPLGPEEARITRRSIAALKALQPTVAYFSHHPQAWRP